MSDKWFSAIPDLFEQKCKPKQLLHLFVVYFLFFLFGNSDYLELNRVFFPIFELFIRVLQSVKLILLFEVFFDDFSCIVE